MLLFKDSASLIHLIDTYHTGMCGCYSQGILPPVNDCDLHVGARAIADRHENSQIDRTIRMIYIIGQ